MIVDLMLNGLLSVMAGTTTLPGVDSDYWYSDWGPALLSGDVTPDTSLQTTAMMACVAKRTQTFAALPFHIYGRGGPAWPGSKRQSRYRATDHPLETLLNYQPNDWQSAFEFREMMEGHLCMRGNAYALIIPGPLGAVSQLIPKHPDRMQVGRLDTGRLGYLYTNAQGRQEKYTQDQIFHLRWFSVDGITGLGPIALQRRAVELSQQAEKHGTQYFKAGKPLGAVKLPVGETMGDDEDAHRRFRRQWREAYSGDDLYSVAILENGMDWAQMGMTNQDAQYLDSRRFQVVEVCRIVDVPPHFIYSAIEHGHTYANVEQTDLFYAKHCLMLWVKRWEQAISRDLLVDQEEYTPKFSLEGLLRADTKTRGEFYDKMVGLGVYNANDVCELEDRNPHPDGETYYIRSDLIPLGSAGVAQFPSQSGSEEASGEIAALTSELVAGPQYALEDQVIDLVEVTPGEAVPVELCVSDEVLSAWARDIAERLAASEVRSLATHVGKAGEDRERFNKWLTTKWAPKQSDYVSLTIRPWAAAHGELSADAATEWIVSGAVNTFREAENPPVVHERWKTERADEIVRLLLPVKEN